MKTKTHMEQRHKIAIAVALLAITYLAAGLAFLGANASTALFSISVKSDESLTRGGRTTYTITMKNETNIAQDLTLEHAFAIPDFPSGKIPLSFVGARPSIKCSTGRSSVSCALGVVPPKGKMTVSLMYSVKECSTGVASTFQVSAKNRMTASFAKIYQLFKKCSLSDRTPGRTR